MLNSRNSGIISNYKVYIIESSHNGGFAYANNIAIKFAMEFNDCESVLLLNNDTEIMPDTISQLVNTKTDKVNACVTGRIFYYGTNILWYDGGGFNKTRGKSWHINAGKPVDRGLDLGLHSVEFVSFCMILIPITVVNLVGLLDESYYMYNEDTDWCYRAKGKDVSLIYNPSAVLYHKVGASSGGKVSCFSAYWTYRNEFVFNKKRRDKLKYVSIALIVLSRPLIAFRWLLRGKSQLAWISLKTVRYAF